MEGHVMPTEPTNLPLPPRNTRKPLSPLSQAICVLVGVATLYQVFMLFWTGEIFKLHFILGFLGFLSGGLMWWDITKATAERKEAERRGMERMLDEEAKRNATSELH